MFNAAKEVVGKTPRKSAAFYKHQFEKASIQLNRLVQYPDYRTESKLRRYVAYIRQIVRLARENPLLKDDIGQFRTQLLDLGTAIVKGLIFDLALRGKTITVSISAEI